MSAEDDNLNFMVLSIAKEMLPPVALSGFIYFGLKSRCSLELFADPLKCRLGLMLWHNGRTEALFLEPAPAHGAIETAETHTQVWLKATYSLQGQWRGSSIYVSRIKLELQQSTLGNGSVGVPMPCIYKEVRIVSFMPSLVIENHWE